jgi:hypothetical protein
MSILSSCIESRLVRTSSWIAAAFTRRLNVSLSWWAPLPITTTRSRQPRDWSQLPNASSLVPLA